MSVHPLLTGVDGNYQNPGALRRAHLMVWGSAPMTNEQAYENFSGDNPFLSGTVQWIAFNQFYEEKMLATQKRKYPDLPAVTIIAAPSKRRMSQPRLKFDFETIHDARLRLNSGVIFIGINPFYVNEVYQVKDDYLLIVSDKKGDKYQCAYKETQEIDLRSPEPQYLTSKDRTAFLMRPPAKQQNQSVTYQSILLKRPGSTSVDHGDTHDLLEGLSRDIVPWTESISHLMTGPKVFRTIRLSRDLAFYRDKEEQVQAEYKGRHLGAVKENCILVDDNDLVKPWIRRDVNAVCCSLKSK